VNVNRRIFAAVTLLLLCAPVARAQQSTGASGTPAASGSSLQLSRPGTTPPPTPAATSPTLQSQLHRWFDLQTAQLETRYRFIESSADVTTTNQWQHKQTFRGAFKFDEAGRYTLQSTLGTGSSFTGSWDPTGVGTGDPTWDFRVRRFYAQAIPVTGLEFAAGSFDMVRGEHTEITVFDNDAFVQGYRASVKRPKTLYLDEISATVGYVGDLTEPNAFKRMDRLRDHNYTQVFAAKKLLPSLSVSADWSEIDHVSTLRQAVRLTSKALRLVDMVRFENYQRVEGTTGYGFAVSAERALNKRMTVAGGWASIDRNFSPLNGDRYARGKRVFTENRLTLVPELTCSLFYTHAVDTDYTIPNKQRLDIVLVYNVLKALQQHHLW
jgi:hypothetical protein